MFRLISMGVAMMALSLLLVSDAAAQRDAGAKMRGEYGQGFWSRSYNRASDGAQAERPATTESYRRFSFEPRVEASVETGRRTVRGLLPRIFRRGDRTVAVQPTERSYRRFSYEPSEQGAVSGGRARPSWHFPKTDPRRYSR